VNTAHIDELGRYPDMSGAPVLMPVRQRFGIRAFGANCWTAPAGEPVVERHDEPNGDEELYVVLRGNVRFEIAGEAAEAGPGTLVHVSPDTVREAVALEPDTVVLAVGAKPGEAFEPKPWKDFQIAFASARAEGEDEARAFVEDALARNPEAWQSHYNAASFEAMSGNVDAALERLRRAIELGPPEVRRYAAEGHFDVLRDDPRWQELVG
jgi:quercetin dioxygenase-like cupin family protein